MSTTNNRVITTEKISMLDTVSNLDMPSSQKVSREWLFGEIFENVSLELEIDVVEKQISIVVEDSYHNIVGMRAKQDTAGVSTMVVGVGVKGDQAEDQVPTPWLKGATQGIDISNELQRSYYEEMKSGEGDIDPWGVMNAPEVEVEDKWDNVTLYQAIPLSQLLSEHITDFPTELFQEVFGEWMMYIFVYVTIPWMYELRFENQHGQVAGFCGHTYVQGTGYEIGCLEVACGMKMRKGEKESSFLTGASEKTTQMMAKLKFSENRYGKYTPYDHTLVTLHTTQQP